MKESLMLERIVFLGATKPNSDDFPLKSNYVYSVNEDLSSIHEKNGLSNKYLTHSFRISCITNLRAAGVPVEEVASIIGRKDISSTYNRFLATSEPV